MKFNIIRILLITCLLSSQVGIWAQTKSITGTVCDTNGEMIIGANVTVKGTTKGTITNVYGIYTVSATPKDIIEISFIGYKSVQKKVGNRGIINVVLEEDSKMLDDVVVVGYGTTKRANLAGAVATADQKAFQSKPSASPINALQGVIPGLVVNRSNGQGSRPGDEATFSVRDVSSVNGGSPLVLIDGAEGNINFLNPNDIESVSVLKDAQASIYGNRAANGVVLVTTKSAAKGKVKVDFNAYYAFKTPGRVKEKVNLLQFAEMDREACSDGSDNPVYSEDELDLIRENNDKVVMGGYLGFAKHYQYHDWTKSLLGKSSGLQNYSLNVSGGTDRYNFYVSGFYQSEDSPLKFGHDDSKRYSLRVKNEVKVLENLLFHSNISYTAHDHDFSSAIGTALAWGYRQPPWAPLYTPSGKFYSWQGYGNPAQELEEGGNTLYANAITTFNFALDWNILPELKISGQAILRRQVNDDTTNGGKYAQWNWDDSLNRYNTTENWASRAFSKQWYRNYNVYAEYHKLFAEKHDLKVMAGAQHEEFSYDTFSATRKNFTSDNFNLALGSSKDQETGAATWAETLRSVYGRLSYVYNDRYIVEINGRYDGTSRFAPGHRWGLFTGYSAAWRLSEEDFIKDLNIFDQLKIRGSWGQMGNCQGGIGRYDYIPIINISSDWPYPFNKEEKSQQASSNMVSLARTWEKLEVTNIGLDIAILNNRLSASVDWFYKKNKNMLIAVDYPSLLGATAPASNNGSLEVKGWEVSLAWRDKVNDFSYSVRGNISDSRNKVTNLGGFSGLRSGLISNIQGYSTNAYFGYQSGGIIRDEATLREYKKMMGVPDNLCVVDMMYRDLVGDGVITATGDPKRGYQGDLVYLGTSNPRYNFGLNIDMEWKGFDLSIFFQGVAKRIVVQDGEPLIPFYPDWHYPLSEFYHNTWSADRPNAKYPILTHDDDRNLWNYRTSDNLLVNAAYVRLKNLQFGYTIPRFLTQKIKVDRLRVYFSGNDLFEIDNIPFKYDPEDNGNYSGYPFMRYFSFGVNLNF